MSKVADEQVAKWLVCGRIAGIDLKEEEEVLKRSLSNSCPGVESHVPQFYSPPRISRMAETFKAILGSALDLATLDPDDQLPWGYDNLAKREKAKQFVQQRRSLLLIGSPMCSAFSQLQHLNFPNMSKAYIERVINYGRKHLEFCIELYRIQVKDKIIFSA